MMRTLNCIMIAGGLALVACANEPAGNAGEAETEETAEETQRLTPVDSEPVVEAPALAPISRAEIEAELEPGAGCSVEEDGKALLIAVKDDAIARPYGTLRHFIFEAGQDGSESGSGEDDFWDGGTFTAGVISILVVPAEGEGEQIEGVTVREATITVSEEGQTGTFEFEGTWECGG